MPNDTNISGYNNATSAQEACFWPRSGNGTFLNYGSAGFNIRNSSFVLKMFINNDGKVGIGTSSPSNFLSVDAGSTTATASTSTALAHFGGDAGLYFGTYDGTGSYGGWLQVTRSADQFQFPLFLNPNGGFVGIGSKKAYNQLHLFGANGTGAPSHQKSASIYLQDSNSTSGSGGALLFGAMSTNATDFGGMFAGIKALATNVAALESVGDLAFYTRRAGTDSSLSESMRIMASGRVGIGTTSPGFPLHVAGSVGRYIDLGSAASPTNSLTAPQTGNADVYTANGMRVYNDFGGNPTWNTSIFSEHVVVASAFAAISDRRIKDIVAKSSARGDLDLINQLQVTDYRLKDRIGSGSALQKGFIAQEVRKVIPEAVSASRNYLPDIYLPTTENLHDAAQKRLSVTLAKPHALAVGDWVRVYGDETLMETEVLAVLSPTAFVVASEKPVAKAFVYGRRVDDFLTVDYDRIFTTGIGAIQELDHKLKDESAEVTRLQNKVADLEGKLAAQVQRATTQSAGDAAEKAALQARVEALEARDQIREAKQVAQQAEQNAKLAALERLITRQRDSQPPLTVNHVLPKRAE
jgi:hypothetical protein